MGIWRDLKAGMRDAAVGLQYMGRGHVTNEEIAAAQRELDRDWQPDIDDEPQDWNDLREEQGDPFNDEPLAQRYYGDGRIVTADGKELETVWWSSRQERPDREKGG